MTLSYLPIEFKLQFDTSVYADVNPLFVLRSVFGKNLRSMCCISKTSVCPECLYRKSCAYSFLFETILPQENALLPGTDRASHPYSFASDIQASHFSEYSFKVTLFGKAIEFFPYIYASFVRAGKDGVFKSRVKFSISDVLASGKSVFLDKNTILTDSQPYTWNSDDYVTGKNGDVLIEIKSPLRFKSKGKYTKDFDVISFMQCLFRRAKTLCSLYGTNDGETYYTDESKLQITQRKLQWSDSKHYSARQRSAMELGGAVGTFKISGAFSPFEIALLDLNRIANAGKNTNFGLGQIDYWIK